MQWFFFTISFVTVVSWRHENPFVRNFFMAQEHIVSLVHKRFVMTMIFIQKDVSLDLRINFPCQVMVGKT